MFGESDTIEQFYPRVPLFLELPRYIILPFAPVLSAYGLPNNPNFAKMLLFAQNFELG